MDFGIKISSNNKNIDDTDSNMSYSSKYSGLKILSQGSFSISAPAVNTWYSVTISDLPSGGRPRVFCQGQLTANPSPSPAFGNPGDILSVPFCKKLSPFGGPAWMSFVEFSDTSMTIYFYNMWNNNPSWTDVGTRNGYYYWLEVA